jgi:hypothetical protein
VSGHTNHLGQPIGFPVEGWTARERPALTAMTGRYCRVVPLDVESHARELFAAYSEDREGRLWTYLPWGPYTDFTTFLDATRTGLRRENFITYAVIDAANGKAAGVASYLNINLTAGSIEVGGIAYSPALQRTRAGTEAIAATNGSATRSTHRRAPPPNATVSVLRGYFARPTPSGCRSPMASGRRLRRRSSVGSTRRISIARAASAKACRR